MDEDERQRKLEAGRAKNSSKVPKSQPLASFRQKRAKSNAWEAKKTQKRKGQADAKNDCPTQGSYVEPALPSTSAGVHSSKTKQKAESKADNPQGWDGEASEHSASPDRSQSPMEVLREEELIALTGKEQLKQLQLAVEKRNEIIAKLSSNLQEALASRDFVQLEAQSLAGQIGALQKQLQQTSVEFQRIKGQSGGELLNVLQHHHGSSAPGQRNNQMEEDPDHQRTDFHQTLKSFSHDVTSDEESTVHKLRSELEEERKNSERISAELAYALSLLEDEKKQLKEREDEVHNLQSQLSQMQTQCLEVEQYKDEKEKLNKEMHELKQRLQVEESRERSLSQEVSVSPLHLQHIEEERQRQEEEMRRLKEKVELVQQLLEQRERELQRKDEEVEGLKATRSLLSHVKGSFCTERSEESKDNHEGISDQGSMNASVQGDVLMERYFNSAPMAYSHPSLNECLDHCSQLDQSAEHSFELNSEMFEDEPLLSISNRAWEQVEDVQGVNASRDSVQEAGDRCPQAILEWPHNCSFGDTELSETSQQHFEKMDLEKDLLNQQCMELREELALKERDLDVLKEEVLKSGEELEEARSRWGQVTKELKQTLWELEEEREKRRRIEEHTALKTDDDLDQTGAFMNKEESATETSTLTFLSAVEHEQVSELEMDKENLHPCPENSQGELLPLQQINPAVDSSEEEEKLGHHLDVTTLQVRCEHLVSELQKTKVELETTSLLLSQRTLEFETVLNELETTRTQVTHAQEEVERLQQKSLSDGDRLSSTESLKSDLEAQVLSLQQKLSCVEAQSAQQQEEAERKDSEMEEQIRKLEQVLEEELEQFEIILKAKDTEVSEEREKWETERQEKEKLLEATRLLEIQLKDKEEEVKRLLEEQVLAVQVVTDKLSSSHQTEIRELMEKHQIEVTKQRTHQELELVKLQGAMEEEQRRQISLIKQVTEREHERIISELTAKHEEELDQVKSELSLEIRESMDAAHKAELQQAQTQKVLELEALRLSLTTVHTSQVKFSQEAMQQDLQEMDQLKQQSQEQLDRLHELHEQEMYDLKEQWKISVAHERALLEKRHSEEMQALKVRWERKEMEANADFQKHFSEIQHTLSATQTELTDTRSTQMETSKALSEARAVLTQVQGELQEAQARIEELQTVSDEQTRKLEEGLKQAIAERDFLEETLHEKNQQALHYEEKEKQLQQEVLRLGEEKLQLKKSSELEIGQLWTQLESMRASRQELGELKEQLLARSSHVDDIERIKNEFNEQKREIEEQNEIELENLRRYFEKSLRSSEESHKEEIALLQLRLVENALDETVATISKDCVYSHAQVGKEECSAFNAAKQEEQEAKEELINSMRLELEEKHATELSTMKSSLALSFEKELQQVRSDISDQHDAELQEMRASHDLQMEQLRVELSESHKRDFEEQLTRLQFETARQVEAEVELRLWCLTEELQSKTTVIHILENKQETPQKQEDEVKSTSQTFVQTEKTPIQEKENLEESEKLSETELHPKLNHDTGLHQGLEAEGFEKDPHEEKEQSNSLEITSDASRVREFDHELEKGKRLQSAEIKALAFQLQEQWEEKLLQAQQRFEEEKLKLEQTFAQRHHMVIEELNDRYRSQLEQEKMTLLNRHSQEMETLDNKHKAQLSSLDASLKSQLAATITELESKHRAELVALEAALNSKRKEDLGRLEIAFQETNQAQLEALEAELARKYQEEKDCLEGRMLENMDVLEATYLKEVQALRNDIVQLEQKHKHELILKESEHQRLIERHASEQLSIREEMRKELAQAHLAKFKAMAAELSAAQKSELNAQREALDAEHCKALEALKKQVLELEQQHDAALRDLTTACAAEKDQLVEQYKLQLQELRGTSARELEAARRELDEESSRQRQHYLEEAELLKVKSEERLHDRINQLKTDFEHQKEVELEDLRRSFTSEQQEKEQSYTDKMSQLTAQLQQLDSVVAQLRAEVGCLQGELQGKSAEMESMDTLLQRRERENHEGANLLKMLTDDLHAAKEERYKLRHANEKLAKVLVEMFRSVTATEEQIGQKIDTRGRTSEQVAQQRNATGKTDTQESGISVIDLSADDLEMTQMLCESLLVSDSQINPAGEESVLNACCRLRQTVDVLLDLLNQANTQLEETRNVHQSLEEKFSKGREDSAKLLEQHKLLLEQLDQEAKLKSQLQLELHKAEGLLDGYVAEKATLEESLQQKESQEEKLVGELEDLKTKLQQMHGFASEVERLRAKHQELSEEHAILLRQKEHLSAGLGEREKALFAETERLAQDRLDLQRQAEKDHSTLLLRLRAVEKELEEQETKDLEKEHHNKTHTEDLNQRVQALEKQLKHNRQFIEEQAVEREHERDEFQQEIRRLEAQLKYPSSGDSKGRMETLQAAIREKTEDNASLLAANQKAQHDLAERNEEIDKLAGRIRELEQALVNSAETAKTVRLLEQELHKGKLREQELTQDKLALEQQQLSSRLQISALQSKLDETKHCYHDNAPDPTQELRDALDTAQQSLHSKEQEAEIMLEQLENVQRDLSLKEVELKHLTLQLELLSEKNTDQVKELHEQISTLQEKVSFFGERGDCSQMNEMEDETLPSALLQEKNHEIDHLNSEIQRLEQELENVRVNKSLEVEIEELQSQVERLQSEIARVRHDKQEEEERLHEVISTLQAELATLGPNLHEVSDSQDGDSFNPSPAPSPEPRHNTIQDQEKRGGPSSLKHELNQTQSHFSPSHTLRSRLKTLQNQLETTVAEKEGLQRLLLTQEEEYRGQGEEFGKRIKAEKDKLNELQCHIKMKESELEEFKTLMEEEKDRRMLSEKERDNWKVLFEDASAQLKEKGQLDSLVSELQQIKKDNEKEIETLKGKAQETNTEMRVLQETSHTLERQVQEMRAEMVDMEKLVAEGRSNIESLEAAKAELTAECELLKQREGQLQQDKTELEKEIHLLKAVIQDLNVNLKDQEERQEEDQKAVLTHADVTLAKADAALRQKEAEFDKLKAENVALNLELSAVKRGLSSSSEKAQKLHEEGQTKERALVDLETDNERLKAELKRLQEDLAVQEEELAFQQKELLLLRRHCHELDTNLHQQEYQQKHVSSRSCKDSLTLLGDDASLSSPEVLRRHECSQDRIQEQFHTSVLDTHLSELSGLNSPALDRRKLKTSPAVIMEPLQSRTITPDQSTQSPQSPGSLSVSDNFSLLDSLDPDKVRDSEGLDQSASPSPPRSTSSISAQEWASDGYGSNVSSELGARLRLELEQTERLDAQFVEYLRCRGMNPAVNTDSAAGSMSYSDDLLSPELQALLKKVYHESCKILNLSQHLSPAVVKTQVSDLNVNSWSQSKENSTPLDCGDGSHLSNPPMSWPQEKRALQETVIALRELLCRMAQRNSQTDLSDGTWQDQRPNDGAVDAPLRAELEERQKQLQNTHETLQDYKKKAFSLRLTVEAHEESLRREQTKIQELQRELELEKVQNLCKEREEAEQKETLQVFSEKLKSEVITLKSQVEQEKVAFSNLKQELLIEQSRSALLEKRLEDSMKLLDDERQHFVQQQEVNLREKSHLAHLLDKGESRFADMHAKLADSHQKLSEERERSLKEIDQLSRRFEASTEKDRKFISDLHAKLQQEKKQSEDLADALEKLRIELQHSRRKQEEEAQTKREEFRHAQETVAKQGVVLETLKTQKHEMSCALEMEREQCRLHRTEVADLKEKLRLLEDRERERDKQFEKERRKLKQEQMERARRQERTNNKLLELESLRQQDRQRMEQLQKTLTELEKDGKEMLAERLSGQTSKQQPKSASIQHLHTQTDGTHVSLSSPHRLEALLKENSELANRVTSLSQEREIYKQRLAALETQLRRTESELAVMNTERENKPVNDPGSNGRMQRYYERYLRAESFRKALVYQKRYLLLLLGGFQDCEQATLCLIARMGARPSPLLSTHRKPQARFRAVVLVVVALSRMKFLTKKWQKVIRRLSSSGNAYPTGLKPDALRPQQQRLHFDSTHNRNTHTIQREYASVLAPQSKSPLRSHNRTQPSTITASVHLDGTSQDPERSLTEYIRHLEKVQQRLAGTRQSSTSLQTKPK